MTTGIHGLAGSHHNSPQPETRSRPIDRCMQRHLPGTDTKTPTRSTTLTHTQAGAFINVFIAGWVADKWGRKAGFLWCGLLSMFGGSMLCGSRNIGMFIAARLFAGAGSWGFLAVTPIYCAELAPPDLRGLMVGSKSSEDLVTSILAFQSTHADHVPQ
jgi:MFS family permease